MSKTDFTIVEWEHVTDKQGVNDFSPSGTKVTLFDGRLTWEQALPTQPTRSPNQSILTIDKYNKTLSSSYDDLRRGGRWPKVGVFTINDLVVAGDEGLLVDLASQSILSGGPLGSSITFTHDYLRNLFGAERTSRDHTVSLDMQHFSNLERFESGMLLVSPGQSVYGHWLMDYLPRLFIAELLGLNRGVVYLTKIHPWTALFLEIFGISMSQVCLLDKAKCHTLASVDSVAVLKSGYLLERTISRQAWEIAHTRLSRGHKRSTQNYSKKIFISRQGWHSRSLSNEPSLSTRAAERGYDVIQPEKLSITDQIAVFENADIIVGPDGSGLHNIIFSRPGTRLGVILMPNRGQLWHATLCDALGHHVFHSEASLQDDGTVTITLQTLDTMLDMLETNLT